MKKWHETGGNISPLLFATFLNDIQDHLGSKYGGLHHLSECGGNHLSDDTIGNFLRLPMLLYANDTLIFAESETEQH